MRLDCCVPFCRRTVNSDLIAPDTEWICQRHWSPVPKEIKRKRAHYRKQLKKVKDPAAIEILKRADQIQWAKAKRIAAERAAGI